MQGGCGMLTQFRAREALDSSPALHFHPLKVNCTVLSSTNLALTCSSE